VQKTTIPYVRVVIYAVLKYGVLNFVGTLHVCKSGCISSSQIWRTYLCCNFARVCAWPQNQMCLEIWKYVIRRENVQEIWQDRIIINARLQNKKLPYIVRIIQSLKVAKECILSTKTAVYFVSIDDKHQSTILTVLTKELRLFAKYLYLYIFLYVQGFSWTASIIYCAYSISNLSFAKCISIMYGFIAPLCMKELFLMFYLFFFLKLNIHPNA